MGSLFGPILERGPAAVAASDESWLAALVEVEAALARAQANVGLISRADAEAIEGACRSGSFDVDRIGREATAAGNPVVPLVRHLRQAVGQPAGDNVHLGATSQDILDTATMLVARRSIDAILADIAGAGDAAARLATAHRDTVMAARTLLQQALPTTFGLKAAGWMVGLDEAAENLRRVRDERLAVQLGGAAGTLAAFGADGQALVGAFAAELDLGEPTLPWHTHRARIAELASALGIVSGAAAKAALDIVLLAQSEVREVREGDMDRGGSSSLPQKRNPIAAVSARAAAAQAPGLVGTLLATMPQEHERAAGSWHAEWFPLRSLLVATGSAVAWLGDALEHLEVDPVAMKANLERGGGSLAAERLVAALSSVLGREAADALVTSVARSAAEGNTPFEILLKERIGESPEFSDVDVDDLLDPRGYLGSAGALVDRALAGHVARADTTAGS
jgi:3-carboxy-cis,cis-muconate cycloisomerase